MPDPSAASDIAEYIPFEESRRGVPRGRFRISVKTIHDSALIENFESAGA
jgi:hypothetical protein